jgi:hypothetical protein
MEIDQKRCSLCGLMKPIDSFYRKKTGPYGRASQCKDCMSPKEKERNAQNRPKRLEYNKAWYAKNRERVLADKVVYHENNRGQRSAYNKIWYRENKEAVSESSRVYQNSKYQNDPYFRLLKFLRRKLRGVLKGKDKLGLAMGLVGCTKIELMLSLQSQFKEGMSWNNYGWGPGKWVVDHVRPCCSFDLTDPMQQKSCFLYANLQPLWWEENMAKRGLYDL